MRLLTLINSSIVFVLVCFVMTLSEPYCGAASLPLLRDTTFYVTQQRPTTLLGADNEKTRPG
ncbi:MAG: hypothetical protein Q8L06_08005, partial [Pseudohongiella sp.]|nr:hypothetical protein [Pseudohongiella sp.]